MESMTVITQTDEDDFIDIEGDSDNITDVTDTTCDKTRSATSSCASLDEDAPFTRNPIRRSQKTTTSTSDVEDEFSNWWKSASEFQKPVEEIIESRKEEEAPAITLNPILRRPTEVEAGPFGGLSGDDGKIYDETGEQFQPPEEEITISPSDVSEEEREKFPEFFSGKTKYSPHNYITIRNTILNLWRERKPDHVNKVMLRPILKKSSGNVNNIGKIHRYLESIGAINFGSKFVWWKSRRRRVPVYRPPKTLLDTDFKLKRALEQRMSGRNRKRPTSYTPELLLSSSIGGYTIDHVNNNAVVFSKVARKDTKAVSKKHALTICKEFASKEECPYDVTVDAAALIVMDVHSHLSTHEVMGLIGGYISSGNNGQTKIRIVCARACKSSASSRHCEMDPVSQSSVCDWIVLRGMRVVGWYHSHPTFPPQPSEIDISTQTGMQSMFDAHDSVFLGVILTPYLKHKLRTTINIVHVDRGGSPFTIPYSVQSDPPVYGSQNFVDLTSSLKRTVASATHTRAKGSSRLPHLLDPVVQASTVTHLDKLIRSLSSHTASSTSVSREENSRTNLVTSFGASRAVVSSLHSDDDESYSINQNFPILADNGLAYQDDCEVSDDVIASDVCVRSSVATSDHVDCWNEIFDGLKSILLKASKDILVK